MKKFICIMLVAIAGALTVVSCTEEAVEPTPKTQSDNSGGGDQGGKI